MNNKNTSNVSNSKLNPEQIQFKLSTCLQLAINDSNSCSIARQMNFLQQHNNNNAAPNVCGSQKAHRATLPNATVATGAVNAAAPAGRQQVKNKSQSTCQSLADSHAVGADKLTTCSAQSMPAAAATTAVGVCCELTTDDTH